MREILTVSIDKSLKKRINSLAKKWKISKSKLVKNAVEKYMLQKEFRELRAKLVPYGENARIFIDDDVFDNTK